MPDPTDRRRSSRRGTALLLLAAPLAALGADEGDAWARLQRWLAGTRDLEARFSQTLVSGALGPGPVESGRLYLERPGRMRWDYERPERKVALVIGERTRFYVAADRQLYEGTLDATEAALVELLSSGRSLDAQYEARPAEPSGAGQVALRLVPRTPSSLGELTVFTRPPDHALRAVELQDGAGNTIRYEFEVVRRNHGLDPRRFDFRPPPGTEIVAQP